MAASHKQIVGMLLDECSRSGVEIRTRCETAEILENDEFTAITDQGAFTAAALVVASGGLSVPSLGGSGFGYRIAQHFGLPVLPTGAGLAPFTFSDDMKGVCDRLSGVSCEAILSNDRDRFREDILFTHRGISGPAALQLSSYWKPGEPFQADLLPGRSARELLSGWKTGHPKALLRTQLGALLPRKLVLELETLHWPEMREIPLAQWPDRQLAAIAGLLQNWSPRPAGTEGYRTAEVTLGGVDTRALSSKTMESPIPGLFFIGEVVDVTGHLGGFNFQWAWSSGYAAGIAV